MNQVVIKPDINNPKWTADQLKLLKERAKQMDDKEAMRTQQEA